MELGSVSTATRLFTVAAANRLVPLLEETFSLVRSRREELRLNVASLQELGFDFTGDSVSSDVAANPEASTLYQRCTQLHDAILGSLNDLTELGVEIKGLDGLVDVRSRYRGRVVYLCWRESEPAFAFWHELDAGFAGRRPIEDPEAFEGMLLN